MSLLTLPGRSISSVMVLVIFVATYRQACQIEPLLHISQYKTGTVTLQKEAPCMYPVTIVSAYYPLNTSKHSLREYNEWMANFFPYVTAPIVLYSPPGEALDNILELRGDLPMTVKVK